MAIHNIDKLLKEFISKFIPQPLSLGIEVSRESAKLALVKQQPPDSAYLLDYAVIPLTGKNSAEISALIKNVLKERNIASGTQAKIIVSGPDVDSKRITLPCMPKDEMAKALRWEAKDHFLLNIAESALDFEILQKKPQEGLNKNAEVIATIAKNSLVDEKLLFLKEIQLAPAGIMPAAYGLYNIYRLCKKQEQQPVAIIDIGGSTTTVVIVKENSLRFARQLGYAGGTITKAMAGTFISDKGKVELSLEAAEALKREIGIPGESVEMVKEGISAAQINSMVRPMIEKTVSDLRGSFDYYHSQFQEGSIAKIYLSGGTSKLKNIIPRLSQRLSIAVEPLDMPEGLRLSLPVEKLNAFSEDFCLMAPAIGAAISGVDDVNLIPAIYKTEQTNKLQFIFIRMVLVTIALILLTIFLFHFAQEGVLRKVLAAKQPQWQQLKEVQNLYAKINQKNTIINQTLKNQVPLYYVFKALSNLLPNAAYLESVSIIDKARILNIRGVVYETSEPAEVVLAKFVKSLESFPLFCNVNLVSSQDKEVSGKQAVEFEINCKLGR